jgi:nucleoid-associated protein YgaU
VPSSGAAKLLQLPSAAGVPKSGDLVMSTLDYDEGGFVTVTGQATPGTVVRAYINDKMVAEGKAGADGRWRLAPFDPVSAGKNKLRLDQLTMDGKAVARLELPFERAPVSPAAVDGRRLVLVRGDSLWNIARAPEGQLTAGYRELPLLANSFAPTFDLRHRFRTPYARETGREGHEQPTCPNKALALRTLRVAVRIPTGRGIRKGMRMAGVFEG